MRRPPTPLSLDGYHLCVHEEHICSSSSGDRRSRHAHPHITLMISMKDAVRVFLRKPRAAPCRERGKHIRRGYDTAPFSRRTTSSGIAFSLNDVCLSRALIRGLSRGTLFPVGVVTTTANERYAVCVHTTTHERKNPSCAVFAVLQAASSQEQYRPIFWRLFFSFAPCLQPKARTGACPSIRSPSSSGSALFPSEASEEVF